MSPLDVKQVAERLAISEASVYQLCAERKIPHFRFGTGRGVIRVREEDLVTFIESCKVDQLPTGLDRVHQQDKLRGSSGRKGADQHRRARRPLAKP
jgi:excisionase family DNA binding protein